MGKALVKRQDYPDVVGSGGGDGLWQMYSSRLFIIELQITISNSLKLKGGFVDLYRQTI